MPLPPSLREGIYNLTLPLTNLIFGVSSLFYAPSTTPPYYFYSTKAMQKSEEESKVLKMFVLKVSYPFSPLPIYPFPHLPTRQSVAEQRTE